MASSQQLHFRPSSGGGPRSAVPRRPSSSHSFTPLPCYMLPLSFSPPSTFPTLQRSPLSLRSVHLLAKANNNTGETMQPSKKSSGDSAAPKRGDEVKEEEEVEEDLPWIQEKAMDLVEFSGTVTQAIPGPRVGQSSLPWLLAFPLAYVGLSFVIAVVKTYKKLNSSNYKRKKQVNKNFILCQSIDELFQKGRDEVQHSSLKGLMQKTGFSMEEILRKYIRYALNEKPFNPDLVMDLIHLRRASMLGDDQIAETLNEISRRIVKEKGPVVMDMSGFTEKGFKRKVAVQSLFGKVFYLSELPEFCSRDSSLIVKEIFGVTDEDADTLRIHTLSEDGDVDSLEKMIDSSGSEEASSSSGLEESNDG